MAPYLPRCIDSLINQTFGDIEIILVDDGSTDGSGKICDEYAAKDSRITVIHKPNGGAADARNVGMDAATGDYLTFVDADDYIEKNAYERINAFACENADILTANGKVIEPDGRISAFEHFGCTGEVFDGKDYLRKTILAKKCLSSVCAKFYSQDFIKSNSIRFVTGRMYEDEEFMPRVFASAKSVLATEVSFYNYVIRPGSTMTGDHKQQQATDFFRTMQEYSNDSTIEDASLNSLVLDRMVSVYLKLYAEGALYRYDDRYSHRMFLLKNATQIRTLTKTLMFAVSPVLYCRIYEAKNE